MNCPSHQNKSTKCVMVIDAKLPLGIIANTAAVLALTLGKKIDRIIGEDVFDASGKRHIGITNMPIPILKGSIEQIKTIKNKTTTEDMAELLVVGFSNAAQTTKNYEAYTKKISSMKADDLQYLGVALYGDKKKIGKLTGNLPLLR